MTEGSGFTYRESGVDVQAGNEAVRLLRERIRTVKHPLVLDGIGGFGGMMRMPPIKDAVLVAGADGAGTKSMIAREMGVYDTVGIDAVAMNVNDVSACGAVPFFVLDYLVVGKLIPERVADIVSGVDEGCRRAECVLLGGETGEHPGHFRNDDDFDIAAFAVGIASRDELWNPGKVADGDVIVGLSSTGVHSNGFSLVRHVLARRGIDLHETFPGSDRSIGDVLLTPTAIYSPVLHDLGHACPVHAAAHITGGGFPDNVGRALPDGLAAVLDLESWTLPPVFAWLREAGVDDAGLLGTFNCGIGMVVVLPADQVDRALEVCAKRQTDARVVGEVVARAQAGEAVRYRGTLTA
ncbi:MAG TPA: phosphoribosylformylglycinamidine cyclo-ligase [Thermoleophilia bacterium]|nr:phosphoribosylformylglycinamidine cyclo-ligase [Thermoleophilia bacterium]